LGEITQLLALPKKLSSFYNECADGHSVVLERFGNHYVHTKHANAYRDGSEIIQVNVTAGLSSLEATARFSEFG
jgi:hypothetical protein